MDDEQAIRALLDRYEAAIRDKDARATIDCYTADIVAYDLAPPLAILALSARDPGGIQQWFDSWRGPIHSIARDMSVRVGGDIAFSFTLRHMTGTKTDGENVDLWFRASAGLVKTKAGWKIAHVHNSVPFAMDGSDRALLDLKP